MLKHIAVTKVPDFHARPLSVMVKANVASAAFCSALLSVKFVHRKVHVVGLLTLAVLPGEGVHLCQQLGERRRVLNEAQYSKQQRRAGRLIPCSMAIGSEHDGHAGAAARSQGPDAAGFWVPGAILLHSCCSSCSTVRASHADASPMKSRRDLEPPNMGCIRERRHITCRQRTSQHKHEALRHDLMLCEWLACIHTWATSSDVRSHVAAPVSGSFIGNGAAPFEQI